MYEAGRSKETILTDEEAKNTPAIQVKEKVAKV